MPVKFSDWSTKQLIMTNLGQQGKFIIEGFEVQAFPDLAPVTLQKRRDIRFLMNQLRQENINYPWWFLLKLFVEYKEKMIIIRTVDEARIFLELLEKDLVGQELKEIAEAGDQ